MKTRIGPACHHIRAAVALRSEMNIERLPNERVEDDQEIGARRRVMNEQMFDFAWSNGRAMTMEE